MNRSFSFLRFWSWTDIELLFWSWIVFKLNWLVLVRLVEHRLQGSQGLLWELSAAWFSLLDKEGLCCLLQHGRLSLCAGLCVCVWGGGGGGWVVKEGEELTDCGEDGREVGGGGGGGRGGVKAGRWGGGGKRRINYRLMWWISAIYFQHSLLIQ